VWMHKLAQSANSDDLEYIGIVQRTRAPSSDSSHES
jgi:hypothetical protein